MQDHLITIPHSFPHLTEAQAAYLAGLIDGEGCIHCGKRTIRGYYTEGYFLNLVILMHTAEPLQTIGKWLDVEPYYYENGKIINYRIILTGAKAQHVLTTVRPYLILKNRQADLWLEIKHILTDASTRYSKRHGYPDSVLSKVDSLWQELRGLHLQKGSYRRTVFPSNRPRGQQKPQRDSHNQAQLPLID